MPYKRVLKRWAHMWGEGDLSDIVRVSRKIMDNIVKEHPEVKQWL